MRGEGGYRNLHREGDANAHAQEEGAEKEGGGRGASATLMNYAPHDSRGGRPGRRWRLRPLLR